MHGGSKSEFTAPCSGTRCWGATETCTKDHWPVSGVGEVLGGGTSYQPPMKVTKGLAQVKVCLCWDRLSSNRGEIKHTSGILARIAFASNFPWKISVVLACIMISCKYIIFSIKMSSDRQRRNMFGGQEEYSSGQNFLQWTMWLLICSLVVPQEKNAAGKAPFFPCSDEHASKKAEVGDLMPVQW